MKLQIPSNCLDFAYLHLTCSVATVGNATPAAVPPNL